MASIVSAGTTSATALNMSADTTGILQLASNNGTVALTITAAQDVGVGLTNPGAYAKFAVQGSASANSIMTQTAAFLSGGANGLLVGTDGTDVLMGVGNSGTTLSLCARAGGVYSKSLNINSAGYVTKPNQVCFNVSISGTPTNTAAATVPFSVAYINVGNAFNTSTYTFTAPIAGKYVFAYSIRVDGFSTSLFFHYRPALNGVESSAGGGFYGGDYINYPANNSYTSAQSTWIYNLAAGDTVRVQNSGGTTSGSYLGYQCSFSGYLLG